MSRVPHPVPADPLAPDDPRPEGPPPTFGGPGTRAPRVFAALALVFFCSPAVLVVAGVGGGGTLPGEQKVPRPRASQGWSAFRVAGLYVTQHLPLRHFAVRADGTISSKVFGNPPVYGNRLAAGNDQALPFGAVSGAGTNAGYSQTGGAAKGHPVVFTGRDGWLFLQGDLDLNCVRPAPLGLVVRRWTQVIQAIRRSGRRVVFAVAPEKSTIYPKMLGSHAINGACALRNKETLWSGIERMDPAAVVPLRQPLQRLERRTGKLLYLPLDSHWNDRSGLVLAERVLRRLGGPAQIRAAEVRNGVKRYKGDITPYVGPAKYGTAPTRTIDRPGQVPARLTAVPLSDGTKVGELSRPVGPPAVIPGTTAFLHDSFGDSPLPMLADYTHRLLIGEWQVDRPAALLDVIRRSHTVIIEVVERSFLQLPSSLSPRLGGHVVTPDFLRELNRLPRG